MVDFKLRCVLCFKQIDSTINGRPFCKKCSKRPLPEKPESDGMNPDEADRWDEP